MKMLITKAVTSENFDQIRFDWFLSQIASTALRVEYCCNPACFKCFKTTSIHKKCGKVIKLNALHYFNKVIELVTLFITFETG